MDTKLLSPHEIERWTPPSLRYIVGCSEIKEHFADMLRVDGYGPNTLFTGGTGTGKTAGVRAYLRTLMCPNRNPSTLDVCGQCQSCEQFDGRYSHAGLYAEFSSRVSAAGLPIHYIVLNCSCITKQEWKHFVGEIGAWNDLTVVYIDNFHRLQERGLMDKALHLMEDPKTVWIATAPSADMLSHEVLERFSVVLSTSLASSEEFVAFLQERCSEWGLNPHDGESLVLLGEHSKLNPRAALHFLVVVAGKRVRAFDGTDVEDYFGHEKKGESE
jgi:hypothetical protein